MRQKAEREIRKATASMKSDAGWYRIDRVREQTALIRKVFDKTIVDMARVGTINLASTENTDVGNAQIGNLITYGETIYVSFTFLDAGQTDSAPEKEQNIPNSETTEPEPVCPPDIFETEAKKIKSERVNITLQGFYRTEWEQFEYFCKTREGKKGIHKVWEMICEYNQNP